MASERSGSLFVYGSLIFPEVWEAVVDSSPVSSEPAQLSGFLAFRVIDETYPGLVAGSSSATTGGILIHGLTSGHWESLDSFEGEFYERVEVVVETLNSGMRKTHRAQTYLVCDGFQDHLSDELWDADKFAKTGLADFLDRFVR